MPQESTWYNDVNNNNTKIQDIFPSQNIKKHYKPKTSVSTQ